MQNVSFFSIHIDDEFLSRIFKLKAGAVFCELPFSYGSEVFLKLLIVENFYIFYFYGLSSLCISDIVAI